MPRNERSAGFVVYRRPGSSSERQYLLLNSGRHWDFAKGHVNKGEDDLAAALRELAEETAITDAQVVPGFQHEISYFFRESKRGLIRKTVMFFLAETASDDVTISREHVDFVYLPFEQALERLTFAAAKQVLQAAEQRLRQTADSSPSDTMS